MFRSWRILGHGVYTGKGICDTYIYLVTEVQNCIFGKIVEYIVMHIALYFSIL
jgi:hypothetical protein